FLHAYGGDGRDDSLGVGSLAEREGFVYAFAQGTPDASGRRTWASVDPNGPPGSPDDVTFLGWLLDRIGADWKVDSRRTFVIGWSLGGFAALRFACARADRIAGVMTYAGAMSVEDLPCSPSHPLSVLLVHGDADRTVSFGGGRGSRTGLVYASAA